MEFKCPTCNSIIYSRKHKLCGQCGATLPPELLLTPAQIRVLEEEQKRANKPSALDRVSDSSGFFYISP
jgi:hypothetical protein